MEQGRHERAQIDPFGQLPCQHRTVIVHITNGRSLGDDLLECSSCGYVVTLSDLYAAIKMPSSTTS